MTSRAMRNFLFRLHAWIGLNIALLLVMIFSTGTFLVFITEIEGFIHKGMRAPVATAQRSATAGEIYDTVRSSLSGCDHRLDRTGKGLMDRRRHRRVSQMGRRDLRLDGPDHHRGAGRHPPQWRPEDDCAPAP